MVSLRHVIENGDFEAFSNALAAEVVWVGLWPGQVCRNREEVIDTFRGAMEQGYSGAPEVIAQVENRLVVDPHVEPPLELNPELHHVFVIEDDRIVELRDFRDRASALAAVGL